jgi:hypothetical protein
MRRHSHLDVARTVSRPAVQRDDVPDSFTPILPRNLEHFRSRGPDTGQMRRTGQMSLALNATDELMCPVARRAIRAIRHRNEAWRERCEPLHRLPERSLHRRIAGRKELERHTDRTR